MSKPCSDALIRTARTLEDEARRLRDMAARIIAAERSAGEFIARRQATQKAVSAVIAAPDDLALEAAKLGLPEHTLLRIAKQARAKGATRAREIRNREIARLARTGLSNAEIGQRFGLSTRTVCRALTQARAS